MIQYFLLGSFYFLLILYFNSKTSFFLKTNLGVNVISFLFAIKIAFALLGVFLTYHFNVETDLKFIYKFSLDETDLLLHHPINFFNSFFESNAKYEYADVFYTNTFWDSLRNAFLFKFIGIINILSFKNIYISTIIYNYFIFWGQIALFNTFSMVWQKQTLAKILGCFFIPSSLFYLSGINKDSLFFLGMCLIIYSCCCIFYLNKKSFSIYAGLLIGLVITLFIRNFFFIIFIPTIFAFVLSVKKQLNPYIVFGIVVLIMAIIFLSTPAFMNIACRRQADFLQLAYAKSMITTVPLQPNFLSFITHLPAAINVAFFRPYIWDSYSFLYFASAAEILLVQILILFFIILKIKNKIIIPKNAIVLFCIFYSIIALMFIGFTIPILGAVTRYRTAFLPLLITPVLCILPLEKFKLYSVLQAKLIIK